MSLSFLRALALAFMVAGRMGWGIDAKAHALIAGIDFNRTLMEGMLSFLLFAGALHVDVNDLAGQKRMVGILASQFVQPTPFEPNVEGNDVAT